VSGQLCVLAPLLHSIQSEDEDHYHDSGTRKSNNFTYLRKLKHPTVGIMFEHYEGVYRMENIGKSIHVIMK